MDKKSEKFVIEVLSKQINTKEDLEILCKELDPKNMTIKEVTFTGNSYSFDACTHLAQLLESCLHLTVSLVVD